MVQRNRSVHRIDEHGPLIDRGDSMHGLTASGQERARKEKIQQEQFLKEHPGLALRRPRASIPDM